MNILLKCWDLPFFSRWASGQRNFNLCGGMSDFRLKAFYSVARNLSFTKASQELVVSQPAVTKHVRELESLYGVRLFDRKGNSISLTEAGKLLMEHCERILDDYR